MRKAGSTSACMIDSIKRKISDKPFSKIETDKCRSFSKIEYTTDMNQFKQPCLRSRSEVDLMNAFSSNLKDCNRLKSPIAIDKVRFRDRVLQKENIVFSPKAAKVFDFKNSIDIGMKKSQSNPLDLANKQKSTFENKPIIKKAQNHTSSVIKSPKDKPNDSLTPDFTQPADLITRNFKGSECTDSGIGNGSVNDANSHRSSILSQVSFDSCVPTYKPYLNPRVLTTFIAKNKYCNDSNFNSKLKFLLRFL